LALRRISGGLTLVTRPIGQAASAQRLPVVRADPLAVLDRQNSQPRILAPGDERRSLLRSGLSVALGRCGSAELSDDAPGSKAKLIVKPRKPYDGFDHGYVLTVQKSQGSQWDDVVLFDESFAFQDSRARWLYTGITRAAKRLSIVV
jgi:UvrD-like helicase C-terminal domain